MAIDKEVVKLRMDYLTHLVAAHIEEGEAPGGLDYPDLSEEEIIHLEAFALWVSNNENTVVIPHYVASSILMGDGGR